MLRILFLLVFIGNAVADEWHVVNVNYGSAQGDAHILISGDDVVLIDAGYEREAKTALIPYMNDIKISRINHLFISHPHKDHYQGVRPILEKGIKVDNLYIKIPDKNICDREIPWGCHYKDVLNLVKEVKSKGVSVHDIKPGYKLKLDNSDIELVHAQTKDFSNRLIDVNDLSLIMKWKVGGFKVLFTGDLNQAVGSYLSNDKQMKADFLKVPHHGGRGLAPNSFFDQVNPDYILIPGPEWIVCGERGSRVREWAEKNKVIDFSNGLHGNIVIKFNKNSGKVYRQKDERCGTSKLLMHEHLPNPLPFKKIVDISQILMLLLD